MAEWNNWSKTVEYEFLEELFTPRTITEIQTSIRLARDKKWRVRGVGSGHAWSNLGVPSYGGGAIVSLAHLNHAAEVVSRPNDHEAIVRVDGGLTVEYLTQWLDKQGLALYNMGDANPQRIAGAVATETHGSGIYLGSISEYVEGISIVNANGDNVELTPEQLPAGRVAIGKLGIVHSIRMRVRKSYFLHHVQKLVSFSEASEAANIADYIRRSQPDSTEQLPSGGRLRHFEYWYYPYTGNAERILRYEVPKTQPVNSLKITDEWIVRASSGLLETTGILHPERIPETVKNAQAQFPNLFQADRVGPWYELLLGKANIWRKRVKTYTMEYQFPFEKLWTAFAAVESSIDTAATKGVFVATPIQIRFSKPSTGSLLSNLRYRSPSDVPLHTPPIMVSFSLSFFRKHRGVDLWMPALEKQLIALGGRPHWGKMYYYAPSETREMRDFERIRTGLDPNGMFNFPQPLYTPDPRAFQP